MAKRIKSAAQQVDPSFNQANQTIQGGIGDLNQAYEMLSGGLEESAGGFTEQILANATRRGVVGPATERQVGGALQDSAALQQNILGAQQAKSVAGLEGAKGQAGVAKVQAGSDMAEQMLAGRLQRQQFELDKKLQSKQFKLDRKTMEQEHKLEMLREQRAFEVDKVGYAVREAKRRAAEARAAKDLKTSQALIPARAELMALKKEGLIGTDDFIHPAAWNEARTQWMQKGYSGSTFDSEFGFLINPAHVRPRKGDENQKLGIYQGYEPNTGTHNRLKKGVYQPDNSWMFR